MMIWQPQPTERKRGPGMSDNCSPNKAVKHIMKRFIPQAKHPKTELRERRRLAWRIYDDTLHIRMHAMDIWPAGKGVQDRRKN